MISHSSSASDLLNNRYWRDQSFRKQMKKADERYDKLKEQSHISNKNRDATVLLSKLETSTELRTNVYFIYGISINQNCNIDELTSIFISNFPKPTISYILVYFNHGDSSNPFNKFTNMLATLPLNFLIRFESLYVVRPFLSMKAKKMLPSVLSQNFTITKYIEDKIHFVKSIKQLSQKLNISSKQLLACTIQNVRLQFASQQNNISMPLFFCSNNLIDQRKTCQSQINNFKFKPPLLQIQQYDIQNKIPKTLIFLINYFKQHRDQLKQQGIFRKSANIQQQDEALQQMSLNHYQFLNKRNNPHLISNLIKRFLSKLKSPLIPYQIFQTLMSQQKITPTFLYSQIAQLKKQNIIKYQTLKYLICFLHQYVIPQSQYNKMNDKNISICFAPCIMSAKQKSIKDLIYISKSILAFNTMLNHYNEIFCDSHSMKKTHNKIQLVEIGINLQNGNQQQDQKNQQQKQNKQQQVIINQSHQTNDLQQPVIYQR